MWPIADFDLAPTSPGHVDANTTRHSGHLTNQTHTTALIKTAVVHCQMGVDVPYRMHELQVEISPWRLQNQFKATDTTRQSRSSRFSSFKGVPQLQIAAENGPSACTAPTALCAGLVACACYRPWSSRITMPGPHRAPLCLLHAPEAPGVAWWGRGGSIYSPQGSRDLKIAEIY